MDEHRIKRSMEQARYHLARAESESQAAQRYLDPKADDEPGSRVFSEVRISPVQYL